jgi:hypothetical protein
MPDASTSRKRVLRVTQGFETSRLEKGLLAVAYERAAPIISRRPTGRTASDLSHAKVPTEMDFQPSFATERYVG